MGKDSRGVVLCTDGAYTYSDLFNICADRYPAQDYPLEGVSPHPGVQKRIDWRLADGTRNTKSLDDLFFLAYKSMVERGNSSLCAAFGSLTWLIRKKKTNASEEDDIVVRQNGDESAEYIRIKTPILLLPVKLTKTGSKNYYLRPLDADSNEVSVNPAWIIKFAEEYGKSEAEALLPDEGRTIPLSNSKDGEEFDIEKYFEHLERIFSSWGEGFYFDKSYVCIDKYDYGKVCMYNDVLKNEQYIAKNKILRALFGEKIQLPAEQSDKLEKMDKLSFGDEMCPALMDNLSLKDSFYVLDADSSQCEVIERFKNGESFILEGPPGTGKTQTIVNMIADGMKRGKSILFVSGKMSALKTVLKKLTLLGGVNIDKHCLLILGEDESYKTDLSDTYSKLNASLNCAPAKFDEKKYDDNCNNLGRYRDYIKGYNKELYNAENSLKMSPYDIMGRLLNLGYKNFPMDTPEGFADTVNTLDRGTLKAWTDALEDVETPLANFLGDKRLTDYALFGLKKDTLNDADRARMDIKRGDIQGAYEQMSSCLNTISEKSRLCEKLYVYPLSTICLLENKDVISSLTKYLYQDMKDIQKAVDEEEKRQRQYFKDVTLLHKYVPSLPSADYDAGIYAVEFLLNNLDCHENEKTTDYVNALLQDITSFKKSRSYAALIAMTHEGMNEAKTTIEERFSKSAEAESGKGEILKDFEEEIFSLELRPLLEKMRSKWRDKTPVFFKSKIKSVSKLCKNMSLKLDKEYVNTLLEKIEYIHGVEKIIVETDKKLEGISLGGVPEEELSTALKYINNFSKYIRERKEDISFEKYISLLTDSCTKALDCAKAVGYTGQIIQLSRILSSGQKIAQENKRLDGSILKDIFPGIGIFNGAETNWTAVCGLMRFLDDIKSGCANPVAEGSTLLMNIKNILSGGQVSHCVDRIAASYNDFYSDGVLFDTDCDHKAYFLSMEDVRIFLEDTDEAKVPLYLQFLKKAEKLERNTLYPFLLKYLSLDRKAYPIKDMSKQLQASLLYKYLQNIFAKSNFLSPMSQEGKMSISSMTDEYIKAEKEYLNDNARIVDRQLHKRIYKNSSVHSYLQSTPGKGAYSVRKLLKQRYKSVSQLAPCIMMSVYSVSKLLPYGLYSFDAVIFDEASQIPEEDALTSIMRTNSQVVICGDPKQMPAMRYFKEKEEPDDGEDNAPCPSIIDFALGSLNNTLKMYSLKMHYRSNHESLIKYSNEHPLLYGKKLVTFPSARQKGKDFGLWHEKVEGDAACSVQGANDEEAKRVCALIGEHFKAYPFTDESEGGIEKYNRTHSLGVIVFGINQKKNLVSFMEKDTELKKVLLYDERVFSISTADEVQGDEMCEMILSLTYGHDKDGKVINSWGHMNRDTALKKFNVAVTRARDNLKFIHSVSSQEITAPTLKYVKDYLVQFEKTDTSDFVSRKDLNTDFVSFIGKICEDVVGADRVVYNFGESERTFRVPIGILSKDRQKIVLGIMCEENRTAQGYSIKEYTSTCPEILLRHGWGKIINVYAVRWIKSGAKERAALTDELNGVMDL